MRAAHQRFSASIADLRPRIACRSSRDRAARSRRARSAARRSLVATAAPRSAASTIASSSGVDATCAPPLSSGSARRRTKSTLKRNRSSCARVAAASASAGASTSNSRVDEAADVRRHRDQEIEQRDRRPRRIGRRHRRPTRPTATGDRRGPPRRTARKGRRAARDREGDDFARARALRFLAIQPLPRRRAGADVVAVGGALVALSRQ